MNRFPGNFLIKGLPYIFFHVLIAAVFILIMPDALRAREKAPGRPNIIYILADDAGYGDFGCYGQQDISTPNIDGMAGEGIIFTEHYAGAPVCAPSRCSLLTGKHTGHGQIRGNEEVLPEGQMSLSSGETTVAEVLKKAGYYTALIGKWGLGAPGSEGEPSRHGFDYSFGYLCQRQAHNYYPDHLWRNGEKIPLDGMTYTHDLFTREALTLIRKNKSRPFFLYLAYTIPHAALQVPDLEPYGGRAWSEDKKRYAAMITRMDRDIGTIKDLLRELGMDGNTLVIFSSDNGPHAEGGAHPSYFRSAGPFRGMKRDLYEGGIRVPMIAWWPGVIKARSRTSHVSAFWDILPTLAELAGAGIPGGIDGISLVPVLLGRPGDQKNHESLYWEFHEQGGKQAVRWGKWKALQLNVRLDPDAPLELYNLESDPGEKQNLAGKYPDVVREMEVLMRASRTESKEFPLPGKMKYGFGPFNGWIYALPLPLLAFLLLAFARKENRRVMMERYKNGNMAGKALFFLSLSVQTALLGISALLPLWFGTWRETWGMVLALAGLAGYGVLQGQLLMRKGGISPRGGIYRFMRQPVRLFTVLFWIGVALAVGSELMLWLVLLLVLLHALQIYLRSEGKHMIQKQNR